MKKIKYMIAMHRFFVTESPHYMAGTNKFAYNKQYPFAYIKFMYYCWKDYVPKIKL